MDHSNSTDRKGPTAEPVAGPSTGDGGNRQKTTSNMCSATGPARGVSDLPMLVMEYILAHFSYYEVLQFRLISRFWDNTIRAVVVPRNRHGIRLGLWNYCYLALCTVAIMRTFSTFLALRYNFPLYFEYDRFISVINFGNIVNQTSALIVTLLLFCHPYFHYLLYINPNQFVLQIICDLFITNREQFFDLNPQFKLHFDNPHLSLMQKLKLLLSESKRLYRLIATSEDAYFATKLKYFPALSTRCRLRIIFLVTVIDMLHFTITLTIIVVAAIVITCFVPIVLNLKLSIFRSGFMYIDLASIGYLTQSLTSCTTSCAYIIALFAFLCLNQMKLEQNAFLAGYSKVRRCNEWQQYVLAQKLLHFQTENLRLLKYCIMIMETIGSDAFFVFFITNLPINIYGVTILLFQPPDNWPFLLAILFLLLIQSGGLICGLMPMISITSSIKCSTKHLLLIQPLLGAKFVRDKIRLLNYYEQFDSAKEVAFTIGSIGKVTKNSIFQFILLYNAYLMFSVSLYRNQS